VSKYLITLEIESETDPSEWYWPETLIIDEDYQVLTIEKGKDNAGV
jgi:hypothetical protein